MCLILSKIRCERGENDSPFLVSSKGFCARIELRTDRSVFLAGGHLLFQERSVRARGLQRDEGMRFSSDALGDGCVVNKNE